MKQTHPYWNQQEPLQQRSAPCLQRSATLDQRSDTSHQRSGIALVTVLIAAVVAIVILNIMNVSLVGEIRGSRSGKVRGEMVQAADGVSEQARLALVLGYKNDNLTPKNFIANLDTASRPAVKLLNGLSGAWNIGDRSNFGDSYGWVDVRATVKRGDESQTVVRRVAFGKKDFFNLAMLAEDTDCMFCHLRVNGDVGNLRKLRPGWGTEGVSGICSGSYEGGSIVKGSVYSSVTVSADCSDLTGSAKKINGAQVTGNIEENTTTNLPTDSSGAAIFPAIERAVARNNANGSLSGGTIIKVANGSSLTAGQLASGGSSPVSKTTPGNVVLIGTPTNPIILDRDVYIEGDVVIKGVVKGRGAIYAERNLYIAGDITNVNPPDPIGSGLCSGLNKNVEADEVACAKKNIQAGRDELRLAARGTIVMGDYTERDASGNLVSLDKRQSADYYREQFGLGSGTRYYNKKNGDELICQGSDTSTCVDVEKNPIPTADILARTADRNLPVNQDAYSYSIRPMSADTSGNLSFWLDDALYRDGILGSKNYTYNTWRGEFAAFPSDTLRKAELIKAGLSDVSADAVVAALNGTGPKAGDLVDASGAVVGYFNNEYGTTVKFINDGLRSYENQITNVSAFLYSNRRIAGKTSMLAMNISGGMITREMGVLAPGRLGAGWMNPARYDFLKNPDAAASDCGQAGDANFVAGTEHCALTVNYDYRLRAGGYGYNMVEGEPGQTVAWRISDSKTERALP
jgi:hypothetical protein